MSKFCKKCGVENVNYASFCKNCGSKLEVQVNNKIDNELFDIKVWLIKIWIILWSVFTLGSLLYVSTHTSEDTYVEENLTEIAIAEENTTVVEENTTVAEENTTEPAIIEDNETLQDNTTNYYESTPNTIDTQEEFNPSISDNLYNKAYSLMTGSEMTNSNDIIVKYNSKGIKIYCLSDKSICKTEQEVKEYKSLNVSSKRPNLSSLSYEEKSSIEMACFNAKMNGPAKYNQCLQSQLNELDDSIRRPDLSSLSYEEKSSIEMACFNAKMNGPAKYNQCLQSQLDDLAM